MRNKKTMRGLKSPLRTSGFQPGSQGGSFSMKSLPEYWDLTGCELYAGEDRQRQGLRYFAHNRNWNLLLLEAGKLRIILGNRQYIFGAGDLVLLAPGLPREFQVEDALEVRWIHFNLDAHLQYYPEWSQAGSGVYLLHPPPDEWTEFQRLFSEISRLCRIRLPGWYRLGYCLIQEILLRGNMLNEHGLDREQIEFASQILQEFPSSASITELAERCSLSRAVFFRKFRKTFGMTPGQYREKQKLTSIRQQLENSTKSLKELAEIYGFENPFYLSTRFRKMFGISPREYRRNYLSSLSQKS